MRSCDLCRPAPAAAEKGPRRWADEREWLVRMRRPRMEDSWKLPAQAQALERVPTALDWTKETKRTEDCFLAEHCLPDQSLKRRCSCPALAGRRAEPAQCVRPFGRLGHGLIRAWAEHLILLGRQRKSCFPKSRAPLLAGHREQRWLGPACVRDRQRRCRGLVAGAAGRAKATEPGAPGRASQ
jgi:hypothetical protein